MEQDRTQRDAMAARGYWLAFQEVKKSVERNILTAGDLAGYRGDRVYIRNPRHVPPKKDTILDCMTALFDQHFWLRKLPRQAHSSKVEFSAAIGVRKGA